ncbi:Nif11-like leader peptide family natural product precursor [Synechococcus sp. NOUM97013]|uniref:Nif11-like leader peptide family natural product precursor n=1 Tax=Synechococcus sp. NOUM97013 TaxID=1442555 RepID=UPI001646A4FE|nr:Nif11-like leader peptide family natural product precursor [Synechococcus sp. NOUM97013]QNI73557.1 nif11-like leader peptide domain protein [Synechococcus sp. NOUM97013]
MSEEQLKAFLEKVKGDTSLQEKLKAAADSDAVLAIAKEAGFSISADDMKKAQSEIEDVELEGAAGGQQRRGCEPCSTWGWHHTSTESAREPCRM